MLCVLFFNKTQYIIKYVPKFFGLHLKDKYFVLQIIESVRKTNNLKNA